ncbi:hypothetical protein K461DRAFT_268890 [Myriangium duriaei CBS 260.36]|uniref:NADH dehydrogenase [ubiquinone] 1 alpha subcomplex assembly factor 3 n=1 Tax=Myriangium duriaei CBS 260.36 TaxID=1168546 RepID=A0A9P4IZG4_9PEZI|nr:hypothetical protein K461DRAFT_268890 [Myriangium duriaei CBS 260.36]
MASTVSTRRITAALLSSTRSLPVRHLRPSHFRPFSHNPHHYRPPSAPPKSRDRGPPSKEDTQTDFGKMDIFTNTPPPSTAVDACYSDGFLLDSGLQISGSGVLLVGGEALRWSPWQASGAGGKVFNGKGQMEVGEEGWGVLRVVWPKPDLLIVGTGKGIRPLAPATRKVLNELGIRVEVQDTRNAAAQFNLLATERGVQQVAAALVPVGWREG